MIQLPKDIPRRIALRVGGRKGENQTRIIREVSGVLADTLAQFEIDSVLRVAHFLAQTCHESDRFCTTVEYASGKRTRAAAISAIRIRVMACAIRGEG